MPDYLVNMSERLARLLDRWTHAKVEPMEEVTAEIEANRQALERAVVAWRKGGAK